MREGYIIPRSLTPKGKRGKNKKKEQNYSLHFWNVGYMIVYIPSSFHISVFKEKGKRKEVEGKRKRKKKDKYHTSIDQKKKKKKNPIIKRPPPPPNFLITVY